MKQTQIARTQTRTININMRCIEIHCTAHCLKFLSININMRCIEMQQKSYSLLRPVRLTLT